MPLTIKPPAVQPGAVSVPLTLGSTAIATASIVPPAVTPPAITVADATMIAALQADGYTVTNSTATSTTSTNTSSPSAPAPAGAIVIVDNNGQLGPQFGGSPTPSDVLLGTAGNPATALIGGNWNSNYTQTLGATAPDGVLALELTPNGPWPIWLPHGYAKAGNSTPNGILTQLAGQEFLELSVYVQQAAAAGVFTLGLAENLGAGSYVGPNAPTAEQMGPVTYSCPALAVGWNNLKVPLSALGLPWTTAPANTDPYGIYKLAMQQHLQNGQTVWIKDAQFTPS